MAAGTVTALAGLLLHMYYRMAGRSSSSFLTVRANPPATGKAPKKLPTASAAPMPNNSWKTAWQPAQQATVSQMGRGVRFVISVGCEPMSSALILSWSRPQSSGAADLRGVDLISVGQGVLLGDREGEHVADHRQNHRRRKHVLLPHTGRQAEDGRSARLPRFRMPW